MKLPKFVVGTGWAAEQVPYPHTLFEAMFAGAGIAVLQAQPDTDVSTLLSAVPDGWQLDFATAARKSGQFIMTRQPVATTFWATPEEAVAYGSVLLTPCYAMPPRKLRLTVEVVEDGEAGTGDCHGRISGWLLEQLGQETDRAYQFRLGAPDQGWIAKGTVVVDDTLSDSSIDLVLPLSAFKCSRKPDKGIHVLDVYLGFVAASEPRPTKAGWQVLQWFSYETVEKDLLPAVRAQAEALLAAQTHLPTLVSLLRLDAKEFELPVLDLIMADRAGLLSSHPFVVRQVQRMLRRRWLDLALGAGLRFTGLMAIPNDALPFGVVATRHLPEGEVIATRFPLRFWGDLRVWHNVGGDDVPFGAVAMSHETAAAVAGDFDGDYFQFISAADFPNLTADIRSWADRPDVEVVKVKERRRSPFVQEELARILLDNMDNLVGVIALAIGRANVAGKLDLVPVLAQELQVAVDKFKYNVENDEELIDSIRNQLPEVQWLADRRNQQAYLTRPLNVGKDEGTVGKLVALVNSLWKPARMLARPLEEFAKLMPKPEKFAPEAGLMNARYGRLVAAAAKADDDEELSRIFRALRDWASRIEEPEQWARALWHAAHAKGSKGCGSLPFHAFPAEVAKQLKATPSPERVVVVGLKYNKWANDLDRLAPEAVVEFRLIEFGGKLRTAAYVDGRLLGIVSSETPVAVSQVKAKLEHRGQAVYVSP